MDENKPDGSIGYKGHRIDYYILGNKMYFDINHFDAFMADVLHYVPPAKQYLKYEGRGAVSLARANGKEEFADYMYQNYREFL